MDREVVSKGGRSPHTTHMHYLISCNGSYGDVYPFIAIGRELQSRGHDVHLVTSGYFERAVTDAGLPFTGIGTANDYERIVQHPDLTHPRRGLRIVADTVVSYLPEAYAVLDRLATPDTVLIGSSLAFAANILHETRGLPWIPIHLAPSIFRSNIAPPRVQDTAIPSWMPDAFKNLVWWIGDTMVIDPIWCRGVNAFRSTLGLSPISRIFKDWIHSPDLTIGLFPDWFAPPQSDWPKGVQVTDFPLFDAGDQPLDDNVTAFLDAGDPPVVFVTGTATASESGFYETSVKACVEAGVRALMLTRFPDQLPSLPDGIRHFDSIPFSQLLPRCAAIVHHGGIGTSSQALKSGIPQVVRPYGFDQFDNSARLVDLGVAVEISTSSYTVPKVAETLTAITQDPVIRSSCSAVASRFDDRDQLSSTCDLILGRS